MIKQLMAVGLAGSFLALSATSVFAHMIVTPNTVGVASTQSFSLGVPTENDGNTVGVRLILPDGLDDVTPDVKPGWQITVKRNGSGSDAPATEIDWTGGKIPSGERDQFLFSAIVPASATTLQWKAYQTYDNGQVVAWDQPPASPGASATDNPNAGPYSTTNVVNDLTQSPAPAESGSTQSAAAVKWAAYAALFLSVIALGVALAERIKTTSKQP